MYLVTSTISISETYRRTIDLEFVSVLLIAVGLAMDAFAVSICKGLAMKEPGFRQMLIIGIWFGGFQALMPVIGYLMGNAFYDLISDYDHWIAFGFLAVIGLNMIVESFSKKDEEMDADIGMVTMLILAIATSIDALAIGITLAMDNTDIVSSSAVIGVVTLMISMIGVKIGSKVGSAFGRRAELLGGIILIGIGTKILLEHLGVF